MCTQTHIIYRRASIVDIIDLTVNHIYSFISLYIRLGPPSLQLWKVFLFYKEGQLF